MLKTLKHILIISLLFLLVASDFSCIKKEEVKSLASPNDFKQILERRKIVFATTATMTNYFIYKSQPMGFQLELIQRYAKYLGVDYEIKVYKDLNTALKWLKTGQCDVIADGLMISEISSYFANFCTPLFRTQLVLVQNKPLGYDSLSIREIDRLLIRNPKGLRQKNIYIPESIAFKQKVSYLSYLVNGLIHFTEMPGNTQEDLIQKVARGEIEYTICHESVAKVNAMLYPQLDIKTKIGYPMHVAWAVRKDAPELQKSLNIWLNAMKNYSIYRQLYRKYFKSQRIAGYLQSEYHSLNKGKISNYDQSIYKYSKLIGWDWRLLASLIYQESKFHADTVSYRGAFGLMQMMPKSAEEYNVDKDSPPSENIRAGVALIKWINEQIPDAVTDSSERMKFVLASYNIGYGHILDARKLARKYNHNPTQWNWNVAVFLKKKAQPKYYNDPLVRNGSAKGFETCNLVEEVWDRYIHFKNLIPVEPIKPVKNQKKAK